jgi:hypothetical protein
MVILQAVRQNPSRELSSYVIRAGYSFVHFRFAAAVPSAIRPCAFVAHDVKVVGVV